MTYGSKSLWFVQKVAFHSSLLQIHMLLKNPADIQFGEVSRATELYDQFGDEQNWVLVLDCDCIQGSVVLYKLE